MRIPFYPIASVRSKSDARGRAAICSQQMESGRRAARRKPTLTSGNPLARRSTRDAARRFIYCRFINRRIAIMNKLSSVALSAALVVAGVAASVSAEAHPYVNVAVGYPDGTVVERFGYERPSYPRYYYERGRYRHRDSDG